MKINGLDALCGKEGVNGAILMCGGPPHDHDRNVAIVNHRGPLMALNRTWRWYFERSVRFTYLAVIHSHKDDPVRFLDDVPGHMTVWGLDTGSVHERVDEKMMIDPVHGSCALFGAIACVRMGFSPVLTAGVYLDEPPYDGFRESWKDWYPYLKDHVRATSERGLIAEMFGVMI